MPVDSILPLSRRNIKTVLEERRGGGEIPG
jgi:hypothetical protein